MPNLPG